jgi:Xaa-Pro dipeptidase
MTATEGTNSMIDDLGTSSWEEELGKLTSQRDSVQPIGSAELLERIARLQQAMRARSVGAIYLDASTSTFYFTGLRLKHSERLHGVVLPAEGGPVYVTPAFEAMKLKTMITLPGEIVTWEENESPTALVVQVLDRLAGRERRVGLDPETPYFRSEGIRAAGPQFSLVDAASMINACRMIKSQADIALIKRAMALTLDVQKATARILHEGITTTRVADFIVEAHRRLGFDAPPNFKIVLFGEATSYPHGVPYPQTLKKGDFVLVDTGATLHGYQSDLTRTYVFGEPSPRQRDVWAVERQAGDAAFAAARIGASCESVDAAARSVIEAAGFGPGYAVPGLPHRTGHGIGLDVHEEPYIVGGNTTPLAPGMCFSIEPMLCIYGEFGVRLEDHAYMGADGPHWFTPPQTHIENPFAASK